MGLKLVVVAISMNHLPPPIEDHPHIELLEGRGLLFKQQLFL